MQEVLLKPFTETFDVTCRRGSLALRHPRYVSFAWARAWLHCEIIHLRNLLSVSASLRLSIREVIPRWWLPVLDAFSSGHLCLIFREKDPGHSSSPKTKRQANFQNRPWIMTKNYSRSTVASISSSVQLATGVLPYLGFHPFPVIMTVTHSSCCVPVISEKDHLRPNRNERT